MDRSAQSSVRSVQKYRQLPVDFLEEDNDTSSTTEDSEGSVLVGGEDDDDEDDPPKLVWYIPEEYTIPLPNGQKRTFVLDYKQRLFVALTDPDSW
jgi:hypothetical protein